MTDESTDQTGEMRIRYPLRLEDSIDSAYRFWIHLNQKQILGAQLAPAAALAMLGLILMDDNSRIPGIVVLVFGGSWPFLYPLFNRIVARHQIRKLLQVHFAEETVIEAEVVFNTEGAFIYQGEDIACIRWKDVTEIRDTARGFTLIDHFRAFVDLRNDCFKDAAQRQQWLEFAQRQVRQVPVKTASDEAINTPTDSMPSKPLTPILIRYEVSLDELVDETMRWRKRVFKYRRIKLFAWWLAITGLLSILHIVFSSHGALFYILYLFIAAVFIASSSESLIRNTIRAQLTKVLGHDDVFIRQTELTDSGIIACTMDGRSISTLPWEEVSLIDDNGEGLEISQRHGQFLVLRDHYFTDSGQREKWLEEIRQKAPQAEFKQTAIREKPTESLPMSDNPFQFTG